MSDERDQPAPETKSHEPARVERAREFGHEAAETRGHQAPEGGNLDLGHPPAGDVVLVEASETHSPATDAPPPTAPPPKPADAAASVRPPPARDAATPSSTSSGGADRE